MNTRDRGGLLALTYHYHVYISLLNLSSRCASLVLSLLLISSVYSVCLLVLVTSQVYLPFCCFGSLNETLIHASHSNTIIAINFSKYYNQYCYPQWFSGLLKMHLCIFCFGKSIKCDQFLKLKEIYANEFMSTETLMCGIYQQIVVIIDSLFIVIL